MMLYANVIPRTNDQEEPQPRICQSRIKCVKKD